MFHNLCDFIKDELHELDRKVASGGKLSAQELEYADKLAHMKKSLLTVDAMENPEEYDPGYMYHDGMGNSSYGARGRGRNARRDSMGRYAAGSRVYYDDNMMDELHELMEKAPNEQVRNKYREFISEIQRMV